MVVVRGYKKAKEVAREFDSTGEYSSRINGYDGDGDMIFMGVQIFKHPHKRLWSVSQTGNRTEAIASMDRVQ